jgi:hypothetical protein
MGEGEFVYRSNLADTPLPEMLATIHRYGVPGVMEFTFGERVKRIFLVEGDVIFATSNDRKESLGDFLLQQGKLTSEEYDLSSQILRQTGKRHGTVLVEMGLLSVEALNAAVRDQITMVVWRLFNVNEAQVTFKVGRFRGDEDIKIKIPTPRVVLSGCKRITDAKRLTARLGGRNGVLRRIELPEHLSDLRLEAGEQQLLDAIDGKHSLKVLCESGPFDPGLNARVLYGLSALGLVQRERLSTGGIRIHVPDG